MWYYPYIAIYDPTDIQSGLTGIETIAAAIYAGFRLWHVHPVVAIAGGLMCGALYWLPFRALRHYRDAFPAKAAVALISVIAALAYGYLGFRIAHYFAPADQLWQAAGAVVFGTIALWDRYKIIRG